MSLSALAMFVVALAAASFWLGRRRALAAAGGRASALQSLPGYYGWYAALWSGVPGLVVLLAWLLFFGGALESLTLASLPEGATAAAPPRSSCSSTTRATRRSARRRCGRTIPW